MLCKRHFIARDLAVLLQKLCGVCAQFSYAQVPACANFGLHAQPFRGRAALLQLTWFANTQRHLLQTCRGSQELSTKLFCSPNGQMVSELQPGAVRQSSPPAVCHALSIKYHVIYPYP